MRERERETLDHSLCDQGKGEASKGKSPRGKASGGFEQDFVLSVQNLLAAVELRTGQLISHMCFCWVWNSRIINSSSPSHSFSLELYQLSEKKNKVVIHSRDPDFLVAYTLEAQGPTESMHKDPQFIVLIRMQSQGLVLFILFMEFLFFF